MAKANNQGASDHLKDAIDHAIDHYGSKGTFTRTDIFEYAYRTVGPDGFTTADAQRAKRNYVDLAVRRRMAASVSRADERALMKAVPEQYWAILFPMKRCICVQWDPGDASKNLWVLSMLATNEEWKANYQIKANMAAYTVDVANRARDTATLLARKKVDSLADLAR